MRYWIGRGLMLAGMFTGLYVFWLGMTERIRPGAELSAAAGSCSLFAIGWLLAGGGRK